MGVSADHAATLEAFAKQNNIKHLLLSDFRRQMLPAWGALETNEQSPIYRYAKRAYFVIDKDGVVRYEKIQTNPLDLLNPEEVLKAAQGRGGLVKRRPAAVFVALALLLPIAAAGAPDFAALGIQRYDAAEGGAGLRPA